jgi:4'-phosphopantetheinyl transferase
VPPSAPSSADATPHPEPGGTAPSADIGAADAWFASPPRTTGWRERIETLDALERRRLGSLVEPARARAYAVLHLLARDVLAQVVGCRPEDLAFDRTCARCGEQHGPPRLVDHPGLHVSLSRSRDLVAVAVSTDAPVGIDVDEVAGTRFDGFDAVALHPVERTADLDDRARAVSWVRKEAALKALGTGFAVDPATVTAPAPGRPGAVLPNRPPVSVADVPTGEPTHVAAVALAAAYGVVAVTLHEAPGA